MQVEKEKEALRMEVNKAKAQVQPRSCLTKQPECPCTSSRTQICSSLTTYCSIGTLSDMPANSLHAHSCK